MNNFPAMTAEQRQRLIGFIAAAFASMNGDERLSTGYEGDMEALTKQVFEVALALLTADTSKLAELAAKVRKVREDAADFDGDRRGMWEHQEEQEQLLLEEAVKYTAPPAPVLQVPDGWKLVPSALTAENGAKAALLGEFNIEYSLECHECFGEGCSDCDGEGRWVKSIPVDWTTIKAIWAKGVEHFQGVSPEASNEQ